jgi:hypothetical protein
LRVIAPVADAAVRSALNRLRGFLRDASQDDFDDADDFAEQLVGEIQAAYEATFSTARAVGIVKRTVKAIYSFYRLRDGTPFDSDKAPIRLKFGAPDTRSIRFFEKVDKWYFSKFADNRNTGLREFLRDEYLAKGAALFGRETSESLDDFRQAAGDKLKNLTDRSVKAIVQTSVQRARNWGHVGSLHQAKFARARYVAMLDARTTDLCRGIDGKELRVATAQAAIERLSLLEPGDFAAELYESKDGKAFARDPLSYLDKFTESDGKTVSDDLVVSGIPIPPLHPNCRTRLAGVFEEL